MATLLARARRVVVEHAPRVGMCRICDRVGDCDARAVALAFLAEHDHVTGRR